MGTMNFKTSDIITIGLKPYDLSFDDYLKEYGEEFPEYDDYEIFLRDCYIEECDNIENILDSYNFNIFNISLEPGYYESFFVNIKFDFIFFDDYKEKQEAQKELTRVKKFLLDCIDCELCVCFPGWVDTYLNRKNSIKELNKAIREYRKELSSIPTYKNYHFSIA